MWFFFVVSQRNPVCTTAFFSSQESFNNNFSILQRVHFFKKKKVENAGLLNCFAKTSGVCFKQRFYLFFIKYFLKTGKNLKIASLFNSAFQNLYTSSFEDVAEKKKKYSNFFFIFNMLRVNVDFFNINFFFQWLMKIITYSFFFKVTSLPKFLKKKYKLRFLVEPIFLEKQKRLKASLRIFSLSILTNRSRRLEARVRESLIDLAFNFKKSRFFLEKNMWYIKIFKLLKKKKVLK